MQVRPGGCGHRSQIGLKLRCRYSLLPSVCAPLAGLQVGKPCRRDEWTRSAARVVRGVRSAQILDGSGDNEGEDPYKAEKYEGTRE